MITTRRSKKIFLQSANIDLNPRIVSKRRVSIDSKTSFKEKFDEYDVLTVEVSCFVDQRSILEEEVSDIKVFLSDVSIETLKNRRNVIKEALSPSLSNEKLSLYDLKKKSVNDARRQSEDQVNQKRENERNSLVSKSYTTSTLNDAIYNFDGLNQNLTAKRFTGLSFLTKFNVNEFLGSIRIKNIQDLKQNDEELFGRKTVFKIKKDSSFANKKNQSKDVSLDISFEKNILQEAPTVLNFRNEYFKEVKIGHDPLKSFENADSEMSVEDRLRGSKTIKKTKTANLRNMFKKIAENRLNLTYDESLGFKIVREKVLNRNRVYKTTFEISKNKLISIGAQLGFIHLIFYAYDKMGRKIDSFGSSFTVSGLLQTEINPTLDFQIDATRINRGNIVTKIKNDELQDCFFNLYQKDFSKSNNYIDSIFRKQSDRFLIKKKNSIVLMDGKNQSVLTPSLPKTKIVFQRVTPYFESREIANTKSTGVSCRESSDAQMSCCVYVKQDPESNSSEVTIANLSEDVYAILPVKRVARGTRGSDFKPVQTLLNNELVDQRKIFTNIQEDSEDLQKNFTFIDDDVEEDVIYEYAAFLYNRSGFKQISGNRFFEKRVERENLIQATATSALDEDGENISFEVILERLEDDVDKIINSIFGDNRSLFNDDLLTIKDASNLIYGVRVHKIDTTTGDFIFVGSFRGYKQEDAKDSAATDIPKTYRVNFKDELSSTGNQIYKIEPFIIPPSQVLDKVFASLERIVKDKNKSRSTLNKMLVSKQKIINKDVISQVGTKYASLIGRKGALSSTASFLEKNKNDLFLEGLTGDVIYASVFSDSNPSKTNNLEILSSNVRLLKTLDTSAEGNNYIPKNLADIKFTAGIKNNLVDFYVVVKKINKDPNIIIDGAIHSKDLLGRSSDEDDTYRYLTEIKTNVGLIRYYLFGVSKNGVLLGPNLLGSIILEDE